MSEPKSLEFVFGNSLVKVGPFTYGFENIAIKQWNEGAALTIGKFCSIAPNITIFLGGNHRTDWITTFPFGHIFTEQLGGHSIEGHPITNGEVFIGNDVWIGYGATIMSGITIGDGAVISANATVVRDVKPYEIVGGNPAKLIKKRFTEEVILLLIELSWWNLTASDIKELAPTLSTSPTQDLLSKLIYKYRK